MIKVTYEQLGNYEFQGAVQKLATLPFDGFTAYKVSKFVRAVREAGKVTQKEFKDTFFDKYAQRNEAGEINYDQFQLDMTKKDEFEKAYEEFKAREYTINTPKLAFSMFHNTTKLTAADILSLENAFDMDGADEAPRMTGPRNVSISSA